MKIIAQKRYAVLTGDVVDSSKLPKARRQALTDLLRKSSSATRRAFPSAVPLDAEIFRGDGWQLLVSDPVLSLRIALFFRASLRTGPERGRGLDTRISVGVGAVDFVPSGRVSQGDGEAYRLSGRGLESLPAKQQLVLTLPENASPAELPVVVCLIDALARRWTGQQARSVCGALVGWTQDKIAEGWPGKISQPAIMKHLDTAQWAACEEGLRYVESWLRAYPGKI